MRLRAEIKSGVSIIANGYLFELPDFEGQDDGSNEALLRRLKRVEKYLYSLNEQLRYSMYNLDEDNLSDAYNTRMQQTLGDLYAEFEVTATQIQATVGELEGSMTQITQTMDSIRFDVYNENGYIASQIRLGIDGISLTAEDIIITGKTTLASLFSPGTTVISGDHIDTGSISLDELLVGDSGALYMLGGDLYLYGSKSTSDVYICNPSGWAYVNGGMSVYNDLIVHGQITMHGGGNIANVGQLSAYSGIFEGWCYAPDWTQGSDERIKHDISTLDGEAMAAFVEALRPVRYRLNSDAEDKQRYGFIAQEVRAALAALGLDEGDSPIYREMDGQLGLSYTDLIAPLWAAVQQLMARVKALEEKTASVEGNNGAEN